MRQRVHFLPPPEIEVAGGIDVLAHDGHPEHLVVTSPAGPRSDTAEIRAFYEGLFADVKGQPPTPIRRQYGDGFVVDEVMWNGYIADGRPFGLDGKSGDVSFRLLHVFDIADTKITREAVWCDLAAIQSQLGDPPDSNHHDHGRRPPPRRRAQHGVPNRRHIGRAQTARKRAKSPATGAFSRC